jgi:lysyl-tRNA synthetase class 2
MADLVEEMICHLAETFCGGLVLEHKDEEGNVTKTINLSAHGSAPLPGSHPRRGCKMVHAHRAGSQSERAAQLGVEIRVSAMEDYELISKLREACGGEELQSALRHPFAKGTRASGQAERRRQLARGCL